MPKHAYLSASASHRWLACPPSAKLCAGINDSGSPYAQQGTDAHALCEYKVEKLLGRDPNDPTENLTYFDTEMRKHAVSVTGTLHYNAETTCKHKGRVSLNRDRSKKFLSLP